LEEIMKVFLSWSGTRSRSVASALREWLPCVINEIEPWMSDTDIGKGKRWATEISSLLEEVEAGIIVVTEENLDAPWLVFEAGAISKNAASAAVCTYLVDLPPTGSDHPLSQFQATTATSKADTYTLLQVINRRLSRSLSEKILMQSFERWWPDLETQLRSVVDNVEPLVKIEQARMIARARLSALANSSIMLENPYFRSIVLSSLHNQWQRLEDVEEEPSSYRLPHVLYPSVLIDVLGDRSATVKAVALVGREETFWSGKYGDEIRRQTPENSTRVFVFHSPDHLREHMSLVLQHAHRHHVYVASYDNLVREFPDFAHDFSIIGDISNRVLARYEQKSTGKYIRFSTAREEISEHEDAFTRLLDAPAVRVDPSIEGADEEEDLTTSTFARMSLLKRKPVEMSAYIPVYDYDLYEERHAYFVEMMDQMIRILEEHRESRGGGRVRILEFGAGTGIFTRRLAGLRNVEIVSVEIDWACFHALQHNIEGMQDEIARVSTSVTCVNEDSRTHDHPGRFDFVVSSFADHHIKPYDKPKYFANVARNLKEGSIAIIGDEFLPDYDLSDVEARREALRIYHDHIIDCARRDGFPELVRLEEAALQSGLDEQGDYKLSCREYEELLDLAGFRHESVKIGPTDLENVGGVYVYSLRPRNSPTREGG
jgi:SAM-dependent methyltransferase